MHEEKVETHGTIDLTIWRDAKHCLDQHRFQKKNFCTPRGL